MTPPVLNNDKRLFKLGGVIHLAGGNNSEPWIYKSLAPQRLQNSVPSRA